MTAHIPSDDRAILAAHDERLKIALARLDTARDAFVSRPTARWHLEALIGAATAVRDQAIADLERQLGRAPGAFRCPPAAEEPTGGVIVHAVPPGLGEALTAEERVYTANGPWVAEESKP
jgi:hypothetical protein